MNKFKRIFLIVADSVGAGALDDAAKYGDEGANTLKHLSYAKPNFYIPNLEKLGLGNITEINNTKPVANPLASYGKMKEISVGKDTLTGHWEIMGLNVKSPFPSFEATGFPDELIMKLEEESGHKFIGNLAASGTEIIKDLGQEHMETKAIIIYTSADSVLQLAANEDVIPLKELYRVCEIARRITLENPKWQVGRIIARPFVGTNKDNFTRTPNRHDYAVKPFEKTALDNLQEANYDVISVGKIYDIFDGEGIDEKNKIKNNQEGMDITIEIAKRDFNGLCFVNLVDFDALYGHRRKALGYALSVEEFDKNVGTLLNYLTEDDLLIITADHGNDPTHSGTDHTREHVPLIVYNKNLKGNNLGIRETFADIAATICENFNVKGTSIGTSFLKNLR